MRKILEKILNRMNKKKNRDNGIQTRLDADRIKPFFESLGIDIETIGFPNIRTRHDIPTMRYWCTFDNVKATPLYNKLEGKIKTVVTGNYTEQAQVSSNPRHGEYYPGGAVKYFFRIDDNKLNLREK